MTESLAWWAIPVLSGAFALAGVLVANLAGAINDGRHRRMEDLRRWHDARLQLYFEYVEEWESLRGKLERFVGEVNGNYEDIAVDAISELDRLGQRIRLISTASVYQASSQCYAHLFACIIEIHLAYQNLIENAADIEIERNDILRAGQAEAKEIYESMSDGIARTSVDFVESIRIELGVPGSTAPPDQRGSRGPQLRFWRRSPVR